MQNIREPFDWVMASDRGKQQAVSRHTARFAVSISASLTAGLTTSVDMGKWIFKKITDFPRVPHFFFRNLTCLKLNLGSSFEWPLKTGFTVFEVFAHMPLVPKSGLLAHSFEPALKAIL